MKTETIYGIAGMIAITTGTFLFMTDREYGDLIVLGTILFVGREILVRVENLNNKKHMNRYRHRD